MSLREFFKPRTLEQGEELLESRALRLTQNSENLVQATVRASSLFRVLLRAKGLRRLEAECGCSAARKAQLCKHVAATILQLERVDADILNGRTELAVAEEEPETIRTWPDEIERSLNYFRQNGFNLSGPADVETLNEAKRKLARIFHPDRGGSHEEAVELNFHFQLLIDYRC